MIMIPEFYHGANSLQHPERQEAILRVQRNAIAGDLKQIQSDLRLDLLQAKRDRGEHLDSKTVLILEWHQRFSRVLNECEQPQLVFNEFKELMQRILVDAVFNSALDENCLLGNDGETYSEMGLKVFRGLAPAQFQQRSPLHPNVESPLTTSPHVCARYMVAWLMRHNVDHRNAQNAMVEDAYRQLTIVSKPLPPTSMSQDETMRLIMARQAQRQVQRDQDRNTRIQARRIQMNEQDKAEITSVVRREFAQVEQKVNEVAQRQLEQISELNQDITREINVLQPAIELLEAEIGELAEREKALANQHNQALEGLTALQRTHHQLSLESTQLQQQIDEDKKSIWEILGEACAVFGACALGTFVLNCALTAVAGASGTAASVVVKPKPRGGLLKVAIPF
jgi:hypothetical protein